MDAKELMIGDYIRLPFFDRNAKVIRVGESLIDTNIITPVRMDEIEPIPLTPEILEKNEFECYSRESNLIWGITLPEGHFVLAYMDYYWEFTVDATIYRRIKIQYVHQLQHLLKLCKIEKEIEL